MGSVISCSRFDWEIRWTSRRRSSSPLDRDHSLLFARYPIIKTLETITYVFSRSLDYGCGGKEKENRENAIDDATSDRIARSNSNLVLRGTTFERSIANGSKGKGLSDFATHQGYARREREQHRDLILTLLSHTCLLREEWYPPRYYLILSLQLISNIGVNWGSFCGWLYL